MKRLFMFGLVLTVATTVAFSQEAEPSVDVKGNVTWGFVANPDESQYDDVLDWADISFSGTADEYNTYKFLLEFYGDAPEGGDNPVMLDEAFVTTDVARYFGLEKYGIVIDWRNGYDDSNAAILSAGTRYGFDEITDTEELAIDDVWMSEMTFGFTDVVRLKTAWGWDNAQGEDDVPDILMEASTAISGFNVAASYATNRTTGGTFGATTKVALADLLPAIAASGLTVDLGGSVAHNFSEQDDYDDSGVAWTSIAPEQTLWGASLKAGIAGADVGVSYKGGAEDDENGAFGFAVVGVDAGYQIVEDLGVYGGLAFDFTDYEEVDASTENVDGLAGGEVGASLDIGSSNFKAGYWYTDGYGAGAINALGANQDGGVFFRFTHSWGA